jgi:hypothetical protein
MKRLPVAHVGAALLIAGVVMLALNGSATAEGVTEPTPEPGSASTPALPVPLPVTLPTLPSQLTTPTTAAAPAPLPSLPVSPSSLPGITSPPGGSTGTQNPCADVVDQATESGAPVAASCPLTPTSDGGGDGALCIDVALKPSCTSTQAVNATTTTTTKPSAGSHSSGDPSDPAATSGDPATTNTVAVEAAATTAKKGGGTLPFTGGEVAGLAGLGAMLAASGLALARASRRRAV